MPARFRRLPLLLLLLAGFALAQEPAPAPDTLPYTVEIAPTGDGRLDAALRAVSQLVSLRESAPTTAGGVLGRADGDRERLQRALQSEGYWAGTSRIAMAGTEVGDPTLGERLDAVRQRPLPIRITIDKGPQYRIASIALQADTPAGQRAVDAAAATPYGLAVGDPARAEPVLAAERTLLDRLLAAGHPLATVAGRQTTVDHDRRVMDVAWRFAPGPVAVFAAPAVEGMTRVSGDFLRAQAARIEGERYSPEALEKERQSLMALGAFGSVRARAADRLDEAGRLPVTFAVTERPRHALGVNLAYETNYGPSVRVYWEHRNLFGRAERLRLEAEIARLGTNGGLDQSTYRIGGTYRDPAVFGLNIGPDWAFIGSLYGLRERLEAYDRDAVTFSALLERRFSERLTGNIGPVLDFGSSGPPGGTLTPYQIAGVQVGGRWDAADSLLDPARGWRVNGTLTPSWSFRESTPFAPLRITGSTYWDVLGDRRTILAARGSLGSLLGADLPNVPRHVRFYAGGGGSVRGYDYQSIGPRDALNRPSGGASLVEASLELRQRIWGDIGGVAFVDAGSVGTSSAPDTSNLRFGAGLGLRYYTAIGPIRADIAVPLVKQRDNSAFGLYVGIGQAF
ncbi:autotransporter assembly complex protein TamA [Paracraurococcus lichenis]|uniref:Autotransporter assembly complex family protein n=1 Tax=Paracraurococcus lichenis TaxID=3064888 RepID=A0ABT9DWD6_9PROT|nr:autotransporter assembly complex family protein [Paracraurococcus sp. LOR1-02]MDO9708211.1 autotransporter assembly complex family protein [Paracraurococcus sp. LOR1-02]